MNYDLINIINFKIIYFILKLILLLKSKQFLFFSHFNLIILYKVKLILKHLNRIKHLCMKTQIRDNLKKFNHMIFLIFLSQNI